MIRDGLKALINRQADMEVVGRAENGQQAIELARELQPDVILMDVRMPVMDGIEATVQIKSAPDTARIPVIMFTSLSREEDIDRAKQAGCSGFLGKPVCKEVLNSEVAKILQSLP